MYGTHTQFHVSFLPLYLYPSNPLPPPPRNYWCTFCPRPLMSRHPSSTPLYLLQPVFLISAISTYSPPYLILPLHLILTPPLIFSLKLLFHIGFILPHPPYFSFNYHFIFILSPPFLLQPTTPSPPLTLTYFTSSHKNFSKIILYVFERSTVPCLQDLIHTTVIFLLYFIFYILAISPLNFHYFYRLYHIFLLFHFNFKRSLYICNLLIVLYYILIIFIHFFICCWP